MRVHMCDVNSAPRLRNIEVCARAHVCSAQAGRAPWVHRLCQGCAATPQHPLSLLPPWHPLQPLYGLAGSKRVCCHSSAPPPSLAPMAPTAAAVRISWLREGVLLLLSAPVPNPLLPLAPTAAAGRVHRLRQLPSPIPLPHPLPHPHPLLPLVRMQPLYGFTGSDPVRFLRTAGFPDVFYAEDPEQGIDQVRPSAHVLHRMQRCVLCTMDNVCSMAEDPEQNIDQVHPECALYCAPAVRQQHLNTRCRPAVKPQRCS